MNKSMYLEEMDGVRSVIVMDGLGHWWVVPFEDGDKFYGVDVYRGRLVEVCNRIRAAVNVSDAIDQIMSDEEYFNPAWDRFMSLSEAEQHEMSVTGEVVPCEFVEIK